MKTNSDATLQESGQKFRKDGKYLTFHLEKEEYAIRIERIKEIIGMQAITAVPGMPFYVKGIINLRGKVIPIMDLRRRFAMTEVDATERTCIIVVEVQGTESQVVVGMVVDSVSEVMNIKSEDIEPSPDFGGRISISYILGIAKMEGKVKILLDIDKVLAEQEIAALELT
jgi:purine-binding chemotaxis protein CheW